MEKLLRIGEAAKLFCVSVGTLRHYEKSGILKPEYIDESTGYRYYGARQFEALNTIRYLRALDMPLPQIAEFLKNRDVDVIEEKLKRQKELVRKKIRQLEIIEKKIDNRLNKLAEVQSCRLDEISVIESKPQRIVRIYDSVKLKSYLDLENSIRRLEGKQHESVVFLGKVGVGISEEHLKKREFNSYDCIFLLLDDEDEFDGECETLPSEKCVSLTFRGSHESAAERYARLLDFAEKHDMRISGYSREITVIDYGLTNDTDKFVTEILIPVKA